MEFVLQCSNEQIDRVEYAATAAKKEREVKRQQVLVGDEAEKSMAKSGNGPGRKGRGEKHCYDEYDSSEEVQQSSNSAVNKMTINFSKMKKVVENQHKAENAYRNEIKRGEKSGGLYGKPTSKAVKRTGTQLPPSSTRLPRVAFAARLEKELMELWRMKHAIHFIKPVNPMEVYGYYEKIEQPICLSEIRDKIAQYKYDTANAMLEDVRLMARNSETFNGPANRSNITAAAVKMCDKLATALSHDRTHFGEKGDTIAIMEESIRMRTTQLKRGRAFAAAASMASAAGIPGTGGDTGGS